MSERLAIKSDHVGEWQRGKLRSAVKDLTPRPSDNGRKSSWAHSAEEGELPAILSDHTKASCILQALAIYFFSERFSRANRNRVTGISLFREGVPPDLVIEDLQPHPIPLYGATHRSLLMEDEAKRLETAERLLAMGYFEDWAYTRDEMAELLEYLLTKGYIDSEMQHDARSLLAQWTS